MIHYTHIHYRFLCLKLFHIYHVVIFLATVLNLIYDYMI